MQNKLLKIFIPLAVFFVLPNFASAGPNIVFTNGKWETTFNYPECQQRGGGGAPTIDCASVQNDGIYWSWGATGINGKYTSVVSEANNPTGAGGNGFRQWIFSNMGDNKQTSPVRVGFSTPQKELWVRWYERWEPGFQWLNSFGVAPKTLYFRSTDQAGSSLQTGSLYVHYTENYVRIYNQGGNIDGGPRSNSWGWNIAYPNGVSVTPQKSGIADGQWRAWEIYLKMDTAQTPSANGVGKIWIDGVLVAESNNVDWSGGDPEASDGWSFFEFLSNKKDSMQSREYYQDLDDMVIYNSTPPNTDASGNPFIGPIGYNNRTVPVSDTTAPAAPSGLRVL